MSLLLLLSIARNVQIGKAAGLCDSYPVLPSNKPTRIDTGVSNGISLTDSSFITSDTPGETIDAMNISGGISVEANNVTIKNCRILATGWWAIDVADGVTGTTILHCEIYTNDGGYIGIHGAHITACGNYIHGFENAITVYGGSTLQANYIDRMQSMQSDAHFDGIEIYGGDGLTRIWGNNIHFSDTNGNWMSETGAINLTAWAENIDSVEIHGNWIGGGTYSLYIDEQNSYKATNIRVTNNHWYGVAPLGHAVYGPFSYARRESITAWSGNVWEGDGTMVNLPGESGQPGLPEQPQTTTSTINAVSLLLSTEEYQ
jgi:hypothetical protein